MEVLSLHVTMRYVTRPSTYPDKPYPLPDYAVDP